MYATTQHGKTEPTPPTQDQEYYDKLNSKTEANEDSYASLSHKTSKVYVIQKRLKHSNVPNHYLLLIAGIAHYICS